MFVAAECCCGSPTCDATIFGFVNASTSEGRRNEVAVDTIGEVLVTALALLDRFDDSSAGGELAMEGKASARREERLLSSWSMRSSGGWRRRLWKVAVCPGTR